MRRWTFLLAAPLVLALGCSEKQAADSETTTEQAVQETAKPATEAQVASATLKGTLGCGHCNYQTGTSCSAAVKTAEGEIVILEGVGNGHELFDKRLEQGQVTVKGTRSADGKTFTVASYERQ